MIVLFGIKFKQSMEICKYIFGLVVYGFVPMTEANALSVRQVWLSVFLIHWRKKLQLEWSPLMEELTKRW